MSFFKTKNRKPSADQVHAEQVDGRRAARSRAIDQLRDPMTAVALRTLR
ncbi:hypothetical protein Rhe02_38770 [Rhizocola hellebori]|uniref:Uncharacterized protein n=1 Tax=Rhizocola hellebori TaxID=1392758 RepID=A0A8J3QA14_9ACTN|nr:hypothetical protein [Rhizocola hellebori]GIH05810.1 hypothetical protein Rhe02_38770 [Rhizocola hellebori]